ncbi:peptidoglycan-binding protein [Streptomyces sp. NBC_01604]|uniref:peptidoglycan-binding domain-containing protein n=1 Tax=Streptomyces sp. NBC_01604 TaxID=2975894 RepID=UPI00386C8832
MTTAQQLLRTNADGRYGPATGRAVKTFQRGHRLAADAILRPVTWQHLAPTLRSGAHADSVKPLQAQLRGHGARRTDLPGARCGRRPRRPPRCRSSRACDRYGDARRRRPRGRGRASDRPLTRPAVPRLKKLPA